MADANQDFRIRASDEAGQITSSEMTAATQFPPENVSLLPVMR
jgi:hypothetical protein